MEKIRIPTTDSESRWFERGVKEAIFIESMNPTLNRDGGRYSLPQVWDNIIKRRMRIERMRGGVGVGMDQPFDSQESNTTS